jgi:amino acid adenylation domain-containing protein
MKTTEQGGGSDERTGLEVAVVGMAGRFPGADDIHAFWRNLRGGVESISFFTRDELEGGTAALFGEPHFVPAGAVVPGADELDAAVFGLTPRDAEILNPQHRLFLECAWAALEHAGYDPARVERPVGVFAGSGINSYLERVAGRDDLVRAMGHTRLVLANDKDHLASGVAYRLNLRGPAVAVQTACSTSLVAVHVACQSLINGECDMALAGGSAVLTPFRTGYLYSPDGIASPDGHCRAFDTQARGTVRGNGAGVVVLRRLEDALADGDTIHAVIRGSAINNDGAQKVGYTAPSVTGQARVIREALSVAGVDPGTVQYLETHGSGTSLGDAIELKALGEVLSRDEGGHPWAIGSVKTNVGHMDAAAGVAGLIKTVLALGNRQIPPSLNCAVPHPEIRASGGRVFVNTELRPWVRNGSPRRAGVSSFGIGGTNAHVVLEEAPAPEPPAPSRDLQLLALSARTPTALAAAAEKLAAFLEAESPSLADAAFTLQAGRAQMEHRLAVVCRDAAEGAARLREAASHGSSAVPRGARPVAFLFPGVGMQYVDMGRGLRDAEPAFRDAVDECCALLHPVLGSDLRDVLFSSGRRASTETPDEAGHSPSAGKEAEGGWNLRRLLGPEPDDSGSPLFDTRFAQPAVFVVEYALARLWTSWGVRPSALAGHSLGEYVAACVAGVLRLDDALRLVALRAKLVDALPAGAMLAVPLGEAALREVLPAALDVAAVNTPESCVVAGPASEIDAFGAALAARGTVSRRLPARHAFHSRAMDDVACEVERLVAGFELRAPEIPFVSGVTGTWITDDEARSPRYWSRHLCRTVRFADVVAALREEPGRALLEVGPGQALGAWAMQHPAGGTPGGRVVLGSLRHRHNRVPDLRFLLETLAGLWTAGVAVDWAAFGAGERRMRIPLPGYPFERQRYWVDPHLPAGAGGTERAAGTATIDARPAEGAPAGTDPTGSDVTNDRLPAAQAIETAAPPREPALLGVLTEIVSALTGIDREHVETDVDLFRLGFDSLLLLQAIQAIERRLGVRVSLVELLEDLSTLGALAAHLDRVLPPGTEVPDGKSGGHEPVAAAGIACAAAPSPDPDAPASPTLAPPVAAPAAEPQRTVPAPPALYPPPESTPAAGAGNGMLERLFAQQLQAMGQLMAQQIAAAGAAAAHPAAPAADAASPPAPTDAAHGPGAGPDAAANRVTVRTVEQAPRARIQPETFVPYQVVNPEGRGGMSPRQREYLEGFIARYVEKTAASKAHQVRYHAPLADTRVSARFRRAWKEILYPIVSARALGSRVWDLDGNEYVDTGMSFGCNLFGHAPEFVSRAIREQVERGYGVGPQSPDAGRAAELICELGGNDRAVFCNSGTEAVMGAIRAARTFSGRNRIAVFSGSYHGWADVVLGRLTAGGEREVRPTGPGISPAPLQDVLMLEWDDPASLEVLARHMDELALVMVEPVQSRRLDIHPRAFLHELRRITREAGTLLLFDELITGFRVHPGGAQAHFGVRADLVTYGKIVAGGLPMGVVAGRREVMDVFDGGVFNYGDDSYPTAQRTVFAGAFFKHPLSMAVACSVLEEIRRRGAPMYDRLNERTSRLVARLNALFEAGRYPVAAVHFSSSFRFFFGPEFQHPDLFNHHLVLGGIYMIPETGTHFLSTAHTDDDLETFFQAVRASLEAMRDGGFIPPGPDGRGGETAPGARLPGVGPAPASSPAAARRNGGSNDVRVLPISEGQRQLWLESQMGDDANCAYVESNSIRLFGALDVGAMRAALRDLVARHDALRTTFSADGEAQRVHPAPEVEVPLADLRGPGAGAARLEEWVRGIVRRPFDLVEGPLVRFALAEVAGGEHVLVFTFHHAALDGWSAGVVMRELGELYAAARDGRPAALEPRPDHAALVGARAAAVRDGSAAQAYWEAQFADGVPVLELPTDRPRPASRSYRGEYATRVSDGGLMRRLAEAGRRHGLTMFNTLLSAVFVWLERVTGQDDLVVGAAAAGQAGRAGEADLVGFDMNVLPIRVRVDPSASFAEHARRVRRTVMGGIEHQDFSFPRLVETLLRKRDPSRPPLFSVLMQLDRHQGRTTLGDLRAEVDANFAGGAKVDLTFDLAETADGLRLRLVYGTALFDGDTVERWLASFERLLEEVAADPGKRVSELPLAGPEELRTVVEEWNRTKHPYPHACIHELFEEQAGRTPEAVAVVFGEEQLTYAELDGRADRLAHHLRRRGVGPEDRVALCMERHPDLVTAFFGILKAGAAYVPLDPAHPAERLAHMLQDSGARLLLTQSWLEGRLPPARPATLALDTLGDALESEPAGRPESAVRPENLAYVYYTSGSTGRPKGVAMHHQGPANYFAWAREAYASPDGRGAPVFSSMAVDLTLSSFIPLFAGERVVLVPEGAGIEPLVEVIRAEPAFRIIKITPAHLSLLDQVLTPAEAAASTAALVIGGETLYTDSLRFWRENAPGVRLLNEYGPTETVVGCSLYALPAGEHAGGRVPIGRPVRNLTLYVLDAAMSPVPPGIPGELYVGGVGVARGYLGRPALTAERFVPDPFSSTPGTRLYRTGDRARFLADGNIDFLGRTDFQVKIRGYRIETGEIEGVLLAHPAVKSAVVVAREDAPGDRRLAAYVVLREPRAATAAELRQALRDTLPEYMVPPDVVLLESLPAGSTGKVDRAALPAPAHGAPSGRYEAPRTPTEETLAAIWAEILRLERLGVHDNFFELGGQSLLATRMVSRIRKAYGVKVGLRALFAAPTVAGLAAVVDAACGAAGPALPPVPLADRSRPLPLSFAQERLWFLDRMQPGSVLYSMPRALRLSGVLEVRALERALGDVVRRHEVLRTVFRERDGVPEQVVAPFRGFRLAVGDLSRLDAGESEAEMRRRFADEIARPFDLAAGPLFRTGLLRLGEEEHVLLLAMHHMVSDGWSMDVLVREISASYAAHRAGVEPPLPDIPVQYADHAAWQRQHLQGEVLDRELAYWKQRLAGTPELLELPTDHPRPAVTTGRGGYEPVRLHRNLVERLEALARHEGATLYMALLAGFQVLLSKYAGSDDVVVGTTIAGRTRSGVEGLIGLFMNTLVLRTDLSGDPSFREALRRVREVTLGAFEHQELPFERLVAELNPERSLSRTPLFQVLFELNDTGSSGPALAGLQVSELGAAGDLAKFDLGVALHRTLDGVKGLLTYSTDLFERSSIRRMAEHLERVLEQAAGDPDLRLSRLDLVGASERARVAEWNRTGAAYPAERCIHQLFEAQAERTPAAVAVVFQDRSLTFGELDERANRLANRLRRMGVGPEVRVGLCLERSLELMVCILGVMKAGGAYVPADPAHPAERIAYLLEDSAVGVLLTQERLRARLPLREGIAVVCADEEGAWISGESAEPVQSGVASENLAYVIYTSGSTGRPKGVAMHHRGVCNYIDWGIRAYGADAGSGAPVFSSMAVDLTITNLLPLFAGRPVHLLPEENAVESLARALRGRPEFGLIKITPVHLSLLTPLLTPEEALAAARTLVVGADFLSAETTLFWQDHAPGVRLMNEYGPTETVVGCSAYELPNGLHRAGPVPVGGPIQNLRFHVLDTHLQPVPVGLPGELYIAGAGVARGYLGQAGLTAEKFVPDPFGPEPGGRMYRTGDRARWQPEGNLLILGRTDHQLKIRGYRVEPGEVEAALRREAGVRECLVVVREDVPGDRRLVAYVVGGAAPGELREALLRSLPEYMVPGAFVRLDALPQTPTGKLDPRALPPPRFDPAEERVAPRTPVEEVLAGIWAEVLGLERVGVTESFFTLGGHSLLVTRLIARIRATFDLDVSIRTVFSLPTVELLAAEIERMAYEKVLALPDDQAEQLALTSAAGA